MNKGRFVAKSFGTRSPWVILASLLILIMPIVSGALAESSQEKQPDKREAVRRFAQNYIQAGTKLYQRGDYMQAEKHFLYALDYQEYLTPSERAKLSELLENAHTASIERRRIAEHKQKAAELVTKGELTEAKTYFEKIKENRFSTENERALAAEGLTEIAQIQTSAPQAKQQAAEPLVIEKQPELEIVVKEQAPVTVINPKPAESLTELAIAPVVAEPQAAEQAENGQGYIEVINRKRNILRSHTKAVVNDAVAKAQTYDSQGEFDKAQQAVETAQRTVNENRLHLGDDLFGQYSSQLKELNEQIVQKSQQKAVELEEKKKIEAIEAQEKYRSHVEAERSRRIADLMANATVYQKKQRYEEALGQLESLLALDPLNNQALIKKQTLEDIISFRRQLEIQKEAGKERFETLLKADEAAIPYAKELDYPRNWREIAAKRKPDEAIGLDAANMFVYEQLDEIVDLSELMPETSLRRAIEIIKNSVEPSLKVFVNWRDLDESAKIDQDTQINMDPISAVSLGTGLELLLESVSGGFVEIGYSVKGGIITIATTEQLPVMMTTQVYPIADLISAPANFGFEMNVGESTGGGGGGGRGGGGGGRGGGGGGRGGGGGGGGGSSRGGGGSEVSVEELVGAEAVEEQATAIIELIQEMIEPDSWYPGGQGTIRIYAFRELVVTQTPKRHKEIANLLDKLRKRLGEQVAIEARFLTVSENFLEDIGLDINFTHNPLASDPDSKWGLLEFQQTHSASVKPGSTGVRGTLAGAIASTISGGYGSVLDDLQVSFLLRATQSHGDSKFLNAPKVTVLSGERAGIRVETEKHYLSDYDFEDITGAGVDQPTRVIADPAFDWVYDGTVLNITPIVSPDKKYVVLRIATQLAQTEFTPILIPGSSGDVLYPLDLPAQEVAAVMTKVTVPDGGTLLIGGQRITGEAKRAEGVPVLSKIPLIGRLFENRSEIKDSNILLILVKPTIILREEAETEAIAAMETAF